MNQTILILGADGYLGWPLAMKLALIHPDHKIILADNGWRRNTVTKLGFSPLLTPPELPDRMKEFQQKYGCTNLFYQPLDVCSDGLAELVRCERPCTIYHLAQQCSASYSMLGVEEALHTVRNNEEGNMRLLWAVRNYAPHAHIIKLGSFGEYAKGGLAVAEGYFKPSYKGQTASTMLPYPRAANDIYHVSKINDSNYVAMAARTWGLRITEVMQATVFGLLTDEMDHCWKLFTRFDYDPIFGTVANRFVAQSVYGHPLTIYGRGHQRTGLMSLPDAVGSLARFTDDIPKEGEHRVVNHVTETHYSINELADDIVAIAKELGLNPEILYTEDIRGENFTEKPLFDVETQLKGSELFHTDFRSVIKDTINLLLERRNSLIVHHCLPHLSWNFIQKERPPKSRSVYGKVDDEEYWDNIRVEKFYTACINLNPGCLGTVPQTNAERLLSAKNGNPLALYALGREAFASIKDVCGVLWPAENYRFSITHSTSQTMNLMALCLLRKLQAEKKGPFLVVTSQHEHPGGIGPFEQLPDYEVIYLSDTILQCAASLRTQMQQLQPDVVLLSHVYYHTGRMAQDQNSLSIIKRAAPKAILILDVAQSIGLREMPFGDVDILIGSAHKWLHGPLGVGLAWFKASFSDWLGAIYWNKQQLFPDTDTHGFSIPGGQDFLVYEKLRHSLEHYRSIGAESIFERSCYLAAFFRKELTAVLEQIDLPYHFADDGLSPVVSLAFTNYDPYPLYDFLNHEKIHIKCIKGCNSEEGIIHILRFGIPYYETKNRLCAVIDAIRLFVYSDAAVPAGLSLQL
ncbi:aminotransferase class V-fold PLP-dependent enzyme [Sphingobacterium sp. Lzh-3]|uniref:aminotransferase class V-fold PLP-dependent enzyme n=1 Tax=Sphingobacterium sp. Lzh-3 TaxID=3382150 RepID=UPI00398D139B